MCVWHQGSRHSDEDVLEEQVQKLRDELREARKLYEQEQERVQSTQEDMVQIHNQVHIKYTHIHKTNFKEVSERNIKMETQA